MRLIEFTGVKGGGLWVNPAQILYVGLPDGAGSSMYGENNVRHTTKLYFAQGSHIEVKEALADVVAKLEA
ncbi:MAG: hypothetical protein ACHP84_10140 [Caulobacterales bacterium]|jgi:hypothetical protein